MPGLKHTDSTINRSHRRDGRRRHTGQRPRHRLLFPQRPGPRQRQVRLQDELAQRPAGLGARRTHAPPQSGPHGRLQQFPRPHRRRRLRPGALERPDPLRLPEREPLRRLPTQLGLTRRLPHVRASRPSPGAWSDYRDLAFRKNQGLRIDHILVSEALKPHVHPRA